MLIILINKDVNKFKTTLLLLIPILMMCILFVMIAFNKQIDLTEITKSDEFNQLEDFKGYIREGKSILIWYIISVIIISIKGNTKQKNLFIYLPILVGILVINPILKNIYIKIVTAATYWRLYWIFPMELSIGVAATIVYDIIKNKKYKYTYLIAVIMILIANGKYVYTEQLGFSKFENFEKIPQYIIDEIAYIEKNSEGKVKIVAPNEPWHSCMARQYSTKIQLIHARNVQYVKDEEYKSLYYSLYNYGPQFYNIENINKIIEIYDIDYIILPKDKKIEISDKCNFFIESETDRDYIIKTIKI